MRDFQERGVMYTFWGAVMGRLGRSKSGNNPGRGIPKGKGEDRGLNQYRL